MIPEPADKLGLWAQVKVFSGWPQTNETAVRTLAESWTTAGRTFDTPARFNPAPGEAAWPDAAGREFATATRKVTAKAAETAADTGRLVTAATGFADLVTTTKQGLTDLVNTNLTPYASLMILPPAVRTAAQLAFVTTLGGYAKGLMTAAATQAAALGTIEVAAPPAPGAAAPGTQVPPLDSPLWNTMTDEQLRAIGSRDGESALVRDKANRILLDRAIADNARLRAETRARIDGLKGSAAGRTMQAGLARKLEELERQNTRLTGFRDALGTAADGRTPVSRLLLGFDPSGDGRFIVSRGNPDTARNVATFIPGAESGMDSAALAMRRADTLYQSAADLGSNDTAVITWLNYDSPDFAGAAPLNTWSASSAAPDLAKFQAGLRESHVGPPSHNSLVGHSYGAVVAGAATSGGNAAPVDEVVGVGAINMAVDHASDIKVRPGHVWVIEHQDDFAADTQLLGEIDPSGRGFGAEVHGSEPGPYVDSQSGVFTGSTPAHGNYFDYGDPMHSAGQRRIAQIITQGQVTD